MNVACPPELAPPSSLIAWAKREGARLNITTDARTAVDGADAVVTDCWVSMGDDDESHRHGLREWFGRLLPGQGASHVPAVSSPGALELLNQAMDLMQSNLARLRLAAYAPDLLIQMPRNASTAYEFYRARELIGLGRERARAALAEWGRQGATQRSPEQEPGA